METAAQSKSLDAVFRVRTLVAMFEGSTLVNRVSTLRTASPLQNRLHRETPEAQKRFYCLPDRAKLLQAACTDNQAVLQSNNFRV